MMKRFPCPGFLLWLCPLLVGGADWIPLTDDAALASWRQPTGAWMAAAEAKQSASDPSKIESTPGQGVIVNGPQGRTSNLISATEWGDLEVEVEFLVPKGSNSGVYLMGRYEIQVLDSLGQAVSYLGNACGGIYPRWLDGGNVGGVNPSREAAKAAGQWQSFHIVFRAPRFDAGGRKLAPARFVRVEHNGGLVHENVEVAGPTRAATWENDEKPTGPLMLQGDHGAVAYRKLRVRPLAADPSPPVRDGSLAAMDTLTKQPYPNSPTPLETQLDWVKAAGYSGIAWTACPPEEAARLVRAADERRLRVEAIYYRIPVRKSGLEVPSDLDAVMAALSAHHSIVWLNLASTPEGFPVSSPEGDAVAVPALRKLADGARARGLTVALYPHTGDWVERVQDAVRVAAKAGHNNLGVTFNLCHCLRVGDEARLPDLLAEAAPWLKAVTVNGADAKAAGQPWDRLIRPLGQGDFDVAPVLASLDRLGYRGPVLQQGFGLKAPPPETLTASMAAWRKLLGAREERKN